MLGRLDAADDRRVRNAPCSAGARCDAGNSPTRMLADLSFAEFYDLVAGNRLLVFALIDENVRLIAENAALRTEIANGQPWSVSR